MLEQPGAGSGLWGMPAAAPQGLPLGGRRWALAKVMGLLGTFRETLPFHCTDGETEAQRGAAVARAGTGTGPLVHVSPTSALPGPGSQAVRDP